MSIEVLHEIEAKIDELSVAEKRHLLDRLRDDVRLGRNAAFAASLAAMAADPQIQDELQQIQREFADAEEDGLERF